MAKIAITTLSPRPGKMIIKHPVEREEQLVDGEMKWVPKTVFTTEDGREIQGIMYIVGSLSKEFFGFMKNLHKYEGDEAGKNALMNEVSEEHTRLLASIIVGWEDNGFFSTPYSKEEAMDLMNNDDYFWLKKQVFEYFLEQQNFFDSTPQG